MTLHVKFCRVYLQCLMHVKCMQDFELIKFMTLILHCPLHFCTVCGDFSLAKGSYQVHMLLQMWRVARVNKLYGYACIWRR